MPSQRYPRGAAQVHCAERAAWRTRLRDAVHANRHPLLRSHQGRRPRRAVRAAAGPRPGPRDHPHPPAPLPSFGRRRDEGAVGPAGLLDDGTAGIVVHRGRHPADSRRVQEPLPYGRIHEIPVQPVRLPLWGREKHEPISRPCSSTWASCVVLVTVYAVLFHVIMMQVEGQQHSWITGFYWTLVVMTTLGFGDITFTSDIGRLFSIVVLLSGVVFLLVMLPFLFIRLFYAPWLESRVRLRAPREVRPDTRGHVIITEYDAVAAGLVERLRCRRHPVLHRRAGSREGGAVRRRGSVGHCRRERQPRHLRAIASRRRAARRRQLRGHGQHQHHADRARSRAASPHRRHRRGGRLGRHPGAERRDDGPAAEAPARRVAGQPGRYRPRRGARGRLVPQRADRRAAGERYAAGGQRSSATRACAS